VISAIVAYFTIAWRYNDLLQKELKMDVVEHFTTIQPFWEAFGWLKKPMNNLVAAGHPDRADPHPLEH
jgi:hypothetical protein